MSRPALGTTQNRVISPGVKWQECEVHYSPPSSLQVKNQCRLTIFPLYVFMEEPGAALLFSFHPCPRLLRYSFFQVFQPKLFMHVPRKPHVPPISSFPIWSTDNIWRAVQILKLPLRSFLQLPVTSVPTQISSSGHWNRIRTQGNNSLATLFGDV